ncbi:MAG: thioredoxin family protein [Planctomycetota bacterium]
MKIEVFGPGCSRCTSLAANAKAAADKLGIEYELSKVSDLSEMVKRGVIVTPALAIDGEVKLSGQVPDEVALTVLFREALSKNK